jgi:hypothetical protein
MRVSLAVLVVASVLVLASCSQSSDAPASHAPTPTAPASSTATTGHATLTRHAGNRTGTCTPGQLRLGKRFSGSVGQLRSDIGLYALVLQHVRNTGPACSFVMPTDVTVVTASGATHKLHVQQKRKPAVSVRDRTYRVAANEAFRLMILSDAANDWEPHAHKPCSAAILHPVSVSFATGPSELTINVPHVWRRLCASPSNRQPVVGLLSPDKR